MHAFTHARTHAARAAELAAEATVWRLAREGAPAAPALRDRLGEALIAAGVRLLRPERLSSRIGQYAA